MDRLTRGAFALVDGVLSLIAAFTGAAKSARLREIIASHTKSMTTLDPRQYSTYETLRDGRQVEIRALRPDDRDSLIAALQRVSTQSFYRRFFGVRRDFTEKEKSFFVNVDFANHVALVAVADENGRQVIAGGGRYVVLKSVEAEVAFAVVDQYQGLGIGVALIRHLATIAREAGIQRLVADVLPDNLPMLKAFKRSGFPLTSKREADVVRVIIQLF